MHASCLQHLQPIEQRHRRNANRTAASAWLLPSAQQQWPGSDQALQATKPSCEDMPRPPPAALTAQRCTCCHMAGNAAHTADSSCSRSNGGAAAAVAAHELHNTCCCRTADVVPGWHT